ncbi:MAG: DDE-type integrase/transposase/recombinase [Microbacterium sp.]
MTNDGAASAERVNRKRVARVMAKFGLAGIRLRRRVKTTTPDQSGRRFPDLLGSDLTAAAPNQRDVGDITYLPIADGTDLYLATAIDPWSRKLAGCWAMADHMRVGLVEDTLRAAWRERGSQRGAVFHSDHGSVYTSKSYTALCEQLGVIPSMGQICSSADNTLAESFNATLRCELLDGAPAFSDQRSGHGLPGRVPVGEPPQHPKTPLRDRQRRTRRLRDNRVRYARGSGITKMTPCPRIGVKAPELTSRHGREAIRALVRSLRCDRHAHVRGGLRGRLGLPASDGRLGCGFASHLRQLHRQSHTLVGAHGRKEGHR